MRAPTKARTSVEGMVAALTSPSGVEREQGALGQFDLDLLEGFPADAERQARWHVQHQGGLAGFDQEDGRQVGPASAKVHRLVTESYTA
ncbi:hypothetical protein SHIRM173S_01970 [Streptomyces hirsutus]